METAASAVQHAELVERINQLNILRESNATLRADCESYARKSRDLEAKLKQLTEQLDPAKEEARIAQAELGASKMQLNRLEEENRKWQERNSQLLSKVGTACCFSMTCVEHLPSTIVLILPKYKHSETRSKLSKSRKRR